MKKDMDEIYMDMDDLIYEIYQKEQLQEFEDICKRCGECCGSQDGDPCVNLAKDETIGKYYCKVYENRFGPQMTIGGKIFNCVPAREVIRRGRLKPNCAYNSYKDKIPQL